jgi:hypothetical protein
MAWFGAAGAADTCPWDRLDDLAAETTALCCGADGVACPAAAAADGGVSTPDVCALPCAGALDNFMTRCGAALHRLNPQGTGYAVLAVFEGQCVQDTEDNGEAVLHALGTAQCPADGEAAAPAPAPAPAATALADGEMLIAFKDSGCGADIAEIAATWVAGTDPCAANWFGVTCDPDGAAVIGVDLPGFDYELAYTPFFQTLTGDAGLLGRLPRLTHLDLANTAVTVDLSAFRGCTALAYLHLTYTAVTGDLSALRGCTALTYLDLQGFTAVTGDLSALRGCTALAYLNLSFTAVTGDLSALRGCTALAYLNLDETAVNGDLSALRGCTALAYLSLGGCAGVTGDVGDLDALAALRALFLRYTAAAGWPVAVAGGCTFAELFDVYGGHTEDEYSAAYDHTGLPKDGGAGYTC